MILINHASAPIKKESLSATSKARREASQNKFVKKGDLPDRVENCRKVNNSKNCQRARPGFVKPIQDRLRKIKNLIESRLSRAETGQARRKNGVGLQKEK